VTAGLPPPASVLAPGRPWPLGASLAEEGGVNVAVFSAHAHAVELCLFDAEGTRELARHRLPARTGDVFHGRLPAAGAGLVYGLRAHGPWRPDRGHRFNPHKLLLDPWAREIVGRFGWQPADFGADADHPQHMDPRDNARSALKARVVGAEPFDWAGDRHPRTPLADTVLYEAHVKGFTRRHPGVAEGLRGSYAGLASDAALAHLKRLGVTAVSLMPVHEAIDEHRLVQLGLVNHWGYNGIGFFCPTPRYASDGTAATARREFKAMVRRLHAEGLEVLIDVVYNHTAEADERGPTIAFRGLDNASWYRLPPERRAGVENWTGCGNTLNVEHPRVLQWVLDSLRFWVQEMHVDGFRFDLAPVLGRGTPDGRFDRASAFFQAVAQDPALAGTKLIAEPWDLGPGGYQVGGFPEGWLEWNDRFRDTARAFWLGGDCTRGELALRLAGSSDLYQARRRSPLTSVNYVCSHDGFTLRDLLSYDLRHNEANLEGNRDGHGHNLSWNCGHEGPTSDPEVLARRALLARTLLATVLLAQGTPMLAAGDELGHTQRGNNNPYCQDNELTWIDWAAADEALIHFTARVIALRKALKPFAPAWYTGLPNALGLADLAWQRRRVETLSGDDWRSRMSRVLGAVLGSTGVPLAPALAILVNGGGEDTLFRLPEGRWRCLLDTHAEAAGRATDATPREGEVPLPSRTLQLWQAEAAARPAPGLTPAPAPALAQEPSR
jgi:glycogen operon protein